MACTGARFLLGEPFRSPAITMIQNSTKPEKFGNFVAAYQFYQKLATIFASFALGFLSSSYDL